MIVQKKQDENGVFGPNIPEDLEYESAIYQIETDNYLIIFNDQQLEANRITPAQGRAQLNRDGKLQQIDNYINQSEDEDLKIFWEYSTFWDKNTPTIKSLANAFNINLVDFWSNAKTIEL